MMKSLHIIVLTFFLMLIAINVSAQDYGEIVGTVLDKDSGEPLPYANVMVVGSTVGAATDIEGKFRISQLRAGSYSVQAKFMGYTSITIENVRVSINRITNIDFHLRQDNLVTDEVIIRATKPPVDVEVASSSQLITSDDIQNMPIVTNVKDLVALQSGVIKDGQDIHIRGGRSDEVLYLIDGVPARNPITGVASVEIDVNQIEEVEILTGGFDAEYGNANSGVINIITKSGRDKFTVDLVAKSDAMFSDASSTNYDYAYLGLSGPVPLLPNSGFTVSAKMEGDDTFYKIGGGYGTTKFLGFDVNDRQYGNYGMLAQVHYQPWKPFRIKIQAQFDKYTNKGYSWAWSQIPEQLPITKGETNRLTAIFSHTLSKDSYYNLSLSYQDGKSQTSLLGLNSPLDAYNYVSTYYDYEGNAIDPDLVDDMLTNHPELIDFSKTESVYQRPPLNRDFESDGFIDEGTYKNYYTNDYSTINADFDYTHFIGVHKLKAGFEVNYQRINKLDIENYGQFFPERDTIPGSWPQYGTKRWFFDDEILNTAVYVQDRIEYAGMFLNVGLRADIFKHGNIINDDDFINQFNRATGKEVTEFKDLKVVLSPRVGLSIPANRSTKIFFNYGYFIQAPSFQELYLDPFLNSRIGNPDLDPRKSINYEVGMETEFIKNYVLKVKLYGRDYAGDIGYEQTNTKPALSIYMNTGFGSSRGFEIEFRKSYSNYFSFTTSYTYLLARGFDLTALDQYEIGSTLPPSVREQRVGWDYNNTFKLMANFEVMEYDNLNLWGINLSDIGLYFLLTGTAGRPYTPTIPGAIYVEANSADAPGQLFLDATFHKGFELFGVRNVIFFEVKNLLGIRNINLGSGFNSRTGEVYNFGDLDGTTDKYLTYHQVNFLRANQSYSPDTSFRLGYKLFIR
ncbi:MAG: TonB-dependent receptor [Bacteroidota bacterium]